MYEHKAYAPGPWWEWPAEWAVERAFWREVGTRTVSGMLALILLGTSIVIYSMTSGTPKASQGWPILVGAGLALTGIVIYVAALSIIRAVAKNRSRKVVLEELNAESVSLSTSEIDTIVMSFADGDSVAVPYVVSATTSRKIQTISRRERWGSFIASVCVPLVGAALAVISSLLM